jgi:hypothetical protein
MSAAVIVVSTILLMFGLVPVALLILAFLPLAGLGAWLRRRGTEQLTALKQD